MTTTASRVSEINLVIVPSNDQDRAIEFYEQALGFEKRTDVPFGGQYRWVEVYPPNGGTGIALVPPRPGDPVGVQTGISLASALHIKRGAALLIMERTSYFTDGRCCDRTTFFICPER